MTPEKKAALIRNGIILLLVIGIPAIVFAPRKEKPKQKENKPAAEAVQTTTTAKGSPVEIANFNRSNPLREGQINEILEEAARKRGGIVVGIIHCHAPGNPESEQMADILNNIARRYGDQVKVIRVDITAFPEFAKAEKVTTPPKVVLMAGVRRESELQGLWPQKSVEQKVDEILRGLKRVGKDWRPEVKGMQPAGKPASR